MKSKQIVIDELYNKYLKNGYITEEDIITVCTDYNLSFHMIDYVCDYLLSKGVLITTDAAKSEDELIDYSQVDYEEIYCHCLSICPSMAFVIDELRNTPPPQKGEIYQLLLQIKSGNSYAKNRAAKIYLRAALKAALQYENRTTIPMEDLFSVAVMGLIKSFEKYDEYRNGYFTSYCSLWMKQYIDRYIMDNESIIRIPVHIREKFDLIEKYNDEFHYLPLYERIKKISIITEISEENIQLIFMYLYGVIDSLEELLENDNLSYLYDEQNVCEEVEQRELKENITAVLHTLYEKEEIVIKMRFGLENNHEFTLEEVGDKLGVTRERIRQIEARAIRKLKHPYRIEKLQ